MNKAARALLLVIVLAVGLRLAYIAFAGQTLSLSASGYDDYAVHLLAGEGYTRFPDLHPDSDLPPLYPTFLAGVYSVFGRSAIPVAWVQIGFDVITMLAIYAIGKRVGGLRSGESVGVLAAAFTGFYPYLLFQDLSVNDTAIFMMLLAVGIWAAYRVAEAERSRSALLWALVVGVTFGAGALTKTLIVLMLPLIALWWWRKVGLRRALGLGAVTAVVFVAVVTPWVVRNTQVQGTLTLISTNDGSNLYQGNNSCVADYLLAGWDAQWVDCLNPTPDGLNETETSAWFRDQALVYLREHPADVPRLLLVKFVTLWSPELLPRAVPPDANLSNEAVLQYETPLFRAARVAHLIYFTPLLLLGLIGIGLAAYQRELTGKYAPILMVLVCITAAYLIYHPSTRYRSPADPFLFVLAASAVVWLCERWQARRPLPV